MLGVARGIYAYNENKETGYYTNKPYKKYYTVYRYRLYLYCSTVLWNGYETIDWI
jgi:hypothetical protein